MVTARRTVQGIVLAAGLAACTRTTELLPEAQPAPDASMVSPDTAVVPRDTADAPVIPVDTLPPSRGTFPFCPTTVDVYAGTNGLLPGCAGIFPDVAVGEDGLFSPGTEAYDGTLAGRLFARLAGDPDLVPRFGTEWSVRSCATIGQTLSQLAPQVSSDLCRSGAPEMMANSAHVCSKAPAQVMLLGETMSDDGCHGGAYSSGERQADPAGYIQHFVGRLDAFLAMRSPSVVLLGAQTEWTMAPYSSFSGNEDCGWQRPAWDAMAVDTYVASHATSAVVVPMPDQHATFLLHHPRCCRDAGLSCLIPWYGKGETLNCDGAQTLVDTWYQQLKTYLMNNDFECPSSRIRISPTE